MYDIIFSPSSFGYVFGSIVCIAAAIKLHQKQRTHYNVLTNFLIHALTYGSITVFFFGAPGFFFHKEPVILGWFNVVANMSLMVVHGYLARLFFYLIGKEKGGDAAFWVHIIWGVCITLPINIYFLPLPTFNEYGLEFWNYHPLLLAHMGTLTFIWLFLISIAMLKNVRSTPKKATVIILSIAFTLIGLGASFIVWAREMPLLIAGYLLLFVGGFNTLLLGFSDWNKSIQENTTDQEHLVSSQNRTH